MKDKYKLYLLISFIFHLILFVSFFRIIQIQEIIKLNEDTNNAKEIVKKEFEQIAQINTDQLGDSLLLATFEDLNQEFDEKNYPITKKNEMLDQQSNFKFIQDIDFAKLKGDSLKLFALIEIIREEWYQLLSEVLKYQNISFSVNDKFAKFNSWDQFFMDLMKKLNYYSKDSNIDNSMQKDIQKLLNDKFFQNQLKYALNLTSESALIDRIKDIIRASIESALHSVEEMLKGLNDPKIGIPDKKNRSGDGHFKTGMDGQGKSKDGMVGNDKYGNATGYLDYLQDLDNQNMVNKFLFLFENELKFLTEGLVFDSSNYKYTNLLDSLANFTKDNLMQKLEKKPNLMQSLRNFNSKKFLEENLFANISSPDLKISQPYFNKIYTMFRNSIYNGRTSYIYNHALLSDDQNLLHYYASLYNKFIMPYLGRPILLKYDLTKYQKLASQVKKRQLKNPSINSKIITSVNNRNTECIIPEEVLLFTKLKKSLEEKKNILFIKPDFYYNAYGAAIRVVHPVTIDGDLKDWSDPLPYGLDGIILGYNNIPEQFSDCNKLYAKWDNTGFYFAYWLRDNKDDLSPSIRRFETGDALELFFDPFNKKDSVRIDGSNYQFWVWPREKSRYGNIGEAVFLAPREVKFNVFHNNEIQFASQRKGNKYTCEVFIPAFLLDSFRPTPGRFIGFNYSINNGENIYIRWLTNMGKNISFHPNLWGDLLLMGTNATISAKQKYVVTGQSVDCKIIDIDMNLNADAKDFVNAIAYTKITKDRILITFIESELNSGVFIARLNTKLGFIPIDDKYLSIKPGDEITIKYNDQFSKGGKTNTSIKLNVPVAKAVFVLN